MEPIESRLKARAGELGFTLSGIAPATEPDGFARYAAWLDAGYAGTMSYLHRHRENRQHPRPIVPGVRSVLMLAFEYGQPHSDATPTAEPHQGRVAAYARGPDYHRLIWDRQNELAAWLMAEVPGCRAFGVSDTAPLLERDFARRAGLGWFGKNTMLINKRRGSYFFLGGLLTDLELMPDSPHATQHCGTCTNCLDACPTGALLEPGMLDARKCISYLTIEYRGTIADADKSLVGDWLWGCDVCQEVCPWNREPHAGPFPTDPALATLDPIALLRLTDAQFRQRFRGTVFFRGKRSGLLRNAAIVLGNCGDDRALPILSQAANDPDPVIAEAARWAVSEIQSRTGIATAME
ncbi:MAG: tRNA epoxyqueuosine(34) reductase QueG [Bacteroidales bacterium]|nr:tRNA epoxyqueuosine(34) reductase QueG [Bacteroidales bacterium]